MKHAATWCVGRQASPSQSLSQKHACKPETFQYFKVVVAVLVIVGHCCCLFVPLYYFQHRWHKYFVFFDVWSIKPTAAHVIENDGIFCFSPWIVSQFYSHLQPLQPWSSGFSRMTPADTGRYSWPLMAGMPTIYQLDVWGNQPWVF